MHLSVLKMQTGNNKHKNMTSNRISVNLSFTLTIKKVNLYCNYLNARVYDSRRWGNSPANLHKMWDKLELVFLSG